MVITKTRIIHDDIEMNEGPSNDLFPVLTTTFSVSYELPKGISYSQAARKAIAPRQPSEENITSLTPPDSDQGTDEQMDIFLEVEATTSAFQSDTSDSTEERKIDELQLEREIREDEGGRLDGEIANINSIRTQRILDIISMNWPFDEMEDFLRRNNLYFDILSNTFRLLDPSSYRPTASIEQKMFHMKGDKSLGKLVRAKGWNSECYSIEIKKINGLWTKYMIVREQFKRRWVKEKIKETETTCSSLMPLFDRTVQIREPPSDELVASLLLLCSKYDGLVRVSSPADWDIGAISIEAVRCLLDEEEPAKEERNGKLRKKRSPSPHRHSPEIRTNYQLFPAACGCSIPQPPKGWTFYIEPPCPHRDSFVFQRDKLKPSTSHDYWSAETGFSSYPPPPALYNYPQIYNFPRPQVLVPCNPSSPAPTFCPPTDNQRLYSDCNFHFFGSWPISPTAYSSHGSTSVTYQWHQSTSDQTCHWMNGHHLPDDVILYPWSDTMLTNLYNNVWSKNHVTTKSNRWRSGRFWKRR